MCPPSPCPGPTGMHSGHRRQRNPPRWPAGIAGRPLEGIGAGVGAAVGAVVGTGVGTGVGAGVALGRGVGEGVGSAVGCGVAPTLGGGAAAARVVTVKLVSATGRGTLTLRVRTVVATARMACGPGEVAGIANVSSACPPDWVTAVAIGVVERSGRGDLGALRRPATVARTFAPIAPLPGLTPVTWTGPPRRSTGRRARRASGG